MYTVQSIIKKEYMHAIYEKRTKELVSFTFININGKIDIANNILYCKFGCYFFLFYTKQNNPFFFFMFELN